jgi:integrase
LLLTLYNTGARVSEIIALRREQVRLEAADTHVELLGKGRKERVVPLWADTAKVLRAWFRELGNDGNGVAFPGVRGTGLSRDGVDHLLRRAVATAVAACPSLGSKKVSPHVLRHSTAMHLFQAGVDMAVIALWLGHESLETTHVYVEADLATKSKRSQNVRYLPCLDWLRIKRLPRRSASVRRRQGLIGERTHRVPVGPSLRAQRNLDHQDDDQFLLWVDVECGAIGPRPVKRPY